MSPCMRSMQGMRHQATVQSFLPTCDQLRAPDIPPLAGEALQRSLVCHKYPATCRNRAPSCRIWGLVSVPSSEYHDARRSVPASVLKRRVPPHSGS
jgi:hypothetical protein